ncbi:polyprenol phosphomannose-dependent alpha 1,6 mannosyltransferase MptB [Motilibacter aurantiacus]|uniref:polyprenol phosphomannose-dependent alpha 1,6 mannosyltransferase MptB n=1 Tax=Motilibacter aurantiacus TaxID=2714955 RepID=UPI00140E5D8D|nr:DUF2029 domain-containing protein [Motilibacter aurantiacus]
MTSPARLGGAGVAGALVSVALVLLTGVLGTSATQPPLGELGPLPPYALDAGASSGLVTVLLVCALAAGAAGLGCAAAAVVRGWRPSPRRLLVASAICTAALVCVPPMGSADHLSYASYGRIAALGGDPYLTPPDQFAGDADPVASAVRDPWRSTPSVYGPVATGVQMIASRVAGDDLALTVWLLSLTSGIGFWGTGLLLSRLRPGDPMPLLLWALNPLLLWTLVAGAHVDALAVLPAVGALAALARRRHVAAGVLLALAVAIKLPFALAALGVAWALRRDARALLSAAAGGVATLAVAYALAGPNALDRLGPASQLVSLASPWGPVAHALDGPLGFGTSRWLTRCAAAALALLLALALHRLLPPAGERREQQAARVWLLLALAYVLAAPYVLPWYDALAWAPLAALGGPVLVTAVLAARSTVLAAAYVPGRVEGMSARVEDWTLTGRRDVAPWLGWLAVAALLGWAAQRLRRAPGRGRSPRAGTG